MKNLILIVNTGNTSTKIGVFNKTEPLFVETIRHSDEELDQYQDVNAQKQFREDLIIGLLKEKEIDLNRIAAVSARGGLLKPLISGTYIVNDEMIRDLIEAKNGLHASHLSAQIGFSIAEKHNIVCYVVDPVSVDELDKIARYSGHKLFERKMLSHALNMKAVAKRFAKENKLDYYKSSLIVIHLGTGISISIHRNGRMVDGINSSEEGTFSLDRAGGLPVLQSVKYALDNKLTFKEFSKLIFGNGGFYSYLQTTEFLKIEAMYKDGDQEAINLVHALVYQIAKDVGSFATVVKGKVDKILVTGGMAYSKLLIKLIKKRIDFIAPIELYPGEDEMQALNEGSLRVLENEEEPIDY